MALRSPGVKRLALFPNRNISQSDTLESNLGAHLMNRKRFLKDWLISYGYMPPSIFFSWLAWKCFDLPSNLVSGVFLAIMFLSMSLLRYKDRKTDGERFRFGIIISICLYLLVIAMYIDLIYFDFFNPGPIWIVVAILPAIIDHYIYRRKNDTSEGEST